MSTTDTGRLRRAIARRTTWFAGTISVTVAVQASALEGSEDCTTAETTYWTLLRCPLEAAITVIDPNARDPDPGQPVVVRTHNIEYGIGGGSSTPPTDDKYDTHMAAVAAAMERDRASVVCLQEMYDVSIVADLNRRLAPEHRYRYIACSAMTQYAGGILYDFRNGTPDEPEETATVRNLARYNGTIATLIGSGHAGLVRPPYRFEMAILSDYPIVETVEIELQSRDGAQHHRGALVARIDVPGPDLYVVNVHLTHLTAPPWSYVREDCTVLALEQARAMVARAGDNWAIAPVVMCGDFNGFPAGLVDFGGGVTSASKFEEQDELEAESFWCTWMGVPPHLDSAVWPNRCTRYSPSTPSVVTFDHIWVRNLPNNDALVAHRVFDSGSSDYALDAPGDPGVVSDHWAVQLELPARCTGDLDADGQVGASDLLALLGAWGSCDGCAADLDEDGQTGTSDLLELIARWGGC